MSKMNMVDEKPREQINNQLDDFFEPMPLSQRAAQSLNHRNANTEEYFSSDFCPFDMLQMGFDTSAMVVFDTGVMSPPTI